MLLSFTQGCTEVMRSDIISFTISKNEFPFVGRPYARQEGPIGTLYFRVSQ